MLCGGALIKINKMFTERNEATDSSRNFRESKMALGIAKEMVHDG